MMSRLAAAGLALLASSALARAEPASPIDRQFAVAASVGNTFEISASRLALRTSSDPAVRAFARRMIADHTLAQAKLDRAAQATGADTGQILDDAHGRTLAALQALTGPAFDEAYWTDQSEAHHETLQVLDDFAAGGSDPALLAWAAKTRPVVVMHLMRVGSMSGQ